MPYRYRWVGSNDTAIPDAHVVVNEGDEFESPVELNHPHAVPLDKSGGMSTATTAPPQE